MGVLHREQEFAEYFLSHLLTRTARVEADLVDQLFNSSEMRLARLFSCWPIMAATLARNRCR